MIKNSVMRLRSRVGGVYGRFWTSETAVMVTMAMVIGLITGLGALAFIWSIEQLGLLFSWLHETLAQWTTLVGILIPALGGLIAGPLIYFFAREAKGHGVPEVMQALALGGGRIRPQVVVVKALASAACLSSGGSAGREGPIVQIGAALGSTLGQITRLSDSRIRNLVACGAAAGIAATFNAPIAGVVFALEVLLAEIGLTPFITVVIASVTASIVSQSVLGESPAFVVPAYALQHPAEMLLYLVLGLLAALAARAFVSTLYLAEEVFDHWRFPEWLKPAVGGLAVGLLGLWAPRALGPGLSVIGEALSGDLALTMMAALVVAKIVTTSFTLGSGNSGGVFAPALFMGAMLGGAFGKLAALIFPSITGPAGAYALVGMAAVFAGAAHAPMTAMLIVFEMSRDYRLILPLMLATVISAVIARHLHTESIYTIKLKRRGIDVQASRDLNLMQTILVAEAMTPCEQIETVTPQTPLSELVRIFEETHHHGLPVVDDQGNLCGIVTLTDLERLGPESLRSGRVGDIHTTRIRTAFPDETLEDALRHFGALDVGRIPVVDRANPRRLLGILRRGDIIRAYSHAYLDRQARLTQMERARLKHRLEERVVEIALRDTSRAVGKTLQDLDIPKECVIASIRRGGQVLIPRGKTKLEAGDVVVALVIEEGAEEAVQACLIKNT